MKKFIKIFKALSDETRLRIYLLLLREELCVCEIVNILNIEQSRVSHCLRVLKEADLVDSKRKGTWIIYSASPQMLKSRVIQGIKHEVEPPGDDLKNFSKYKKDKSRSKCELK
ncbi:MAG: helix-turn-helix transcriptional regulator [Candidatus Marinimicrobia bacterium]|nr:helix-turn-helix transcriptional regulator [Candidatus Neomarinimicrobiota bacterium]